jgi:hypothetical protein
MEYEAPVVRDFGSITSHTFHAPGRGFKGAFGIGFRFDRYAEFSEPASLSADCDDGGGWGGGGGRRPRRW